MTAWYDEAITEILKMLTKLAGIVFNAGEQGAASEDPTKRAQANQVVARLTVGVQHISEALAALRQYARSEKPKDPEEKEEER